MPAQQGARGSSPGRLEATQVRAMFDRIAGVYDLMNTAMTAGLHHRWRALAAEQAHLGPGSRVLDVATGTGDLAIELARRVSPGGEVVGSDFAEGMLARARAKASAAAAAVTPSFEWGDALELPYADDSFDAATVGFGARNFDDLAAGLAEMVRVVKPGGRVVLRELMLRTEIHLERVTSRAGAPLASHANATVTAGGKRLRPLLVVLAAESAGGPPSGADGEERLVRAAVAVELVHSATLVHDDLIDGARLRRGNPTVAAVAGRRIAVATGDLLFSRAFAELARNEDAAQLCALSDASSALATGELLQREDAYASDVAVERYLRRCELKTAALFEAACRLGALTAVDGSSTLADALGAFARRIGL